MDCAGNRGRAGMSLFSPFSSSPSSSFSLNRPSMPKSTVDGRFRWYRLYQAVRNETENLGFTNRVFFVVDWVSSDSSAVCCRYCCPLPLFCCCLLLLSIASTATATVVRSTVRCRSQHYHDIAAVHNTFKSSSAVRNVHRYCRSQH
ncbi:hypothetical protein BHE74_00056990 [Ensete ventricosum]|nr:hypothetical protein BHE74_00056990 [Ensete ventricosum]